MRAIAVILLWANSILCFSAEINLDGKLQIEGLSQIINKDSFFNKDNRFNIPEKSSSVDVGLRFNWNPINEVFFSGNGEYREKYRASAGVNKETESRIYDALISYYPNDSFVTRIGKHQTQIGNSLNDLILIPYYTYVTYRVDNRLNFIDDEGMWALSGEYNFNTQSLALYYVPAYETDQGDELRNKNEEDAIQLIYRSLFYNIDLKGQIFLRKKQNPQESIKPFIAMSLSYSSPSLQELTFYIDAAIQNYKQVYKIENLAPDDYAIKTQDKVLKRYSPYIVGIGYLLSDSLEYKVEYLDDEYGMNQQQEEELFQALKNDSTFIYEFSGINRKNLLSTKYLTQSIYYQRVFQNADLFLSWKRNLNDNSSLIAAGLYLNNSSNLTMDLEVLHPVSSRNNTEFGSFVFDNSLTVRFAYHF